MMRFCTWVTTLVISLIPKHLPSTLVLPWVTGNSAKSKLCRSWEALWSRAVRAIWLMVKQGALGSTVAETLVGATALVSMVTVGFGINAWLRAASRCCCSCIWLSAICWGVSAIAWDWAKIGRISHRLIGYIFIVLGKRGNDWTTRLGKLTV